MTQIRRILAFLALLLVAATAGAQYRVDSVGFLVDSDGRRVGFKKTDGTEVFFPTFNAALSGLVKPDGTSLAIGGTPAVADITDIGAVGADLALAVTVENAFDALTFPTTMKTFLLLDSPTDMRAHIGAQPESDFLDDITALDGVCANDEFFQFNGANVVCASIPGGGDALKADGLDQFGETTSAEVAGVVSNEMGTGLLVFDTDSTLTRPVFSGITTLGSGALVTTSSAMAALEVDVTKLLNTKTISAPQTLTFSATPTTGTEFYLFLVNSDTSPHLITLPANVYSMTTNATMASFVIPASSTYFIQWRWNGTVYRMFGEPRAADNYTATAAPTVNDDVSLGYAVGSVWVNITADVAYTCLDATDGAAVWRRSSGTSEDRIVIAISDETTAHTTGTAKVTFRMPYAFVLTGVRGSLTEASSSGVPTWDLNEAGTTVLSTKLTIDANEKTSTTAAAAAVISDSALADDAEMTIDIDTAGTGAKGGKVTLIGYRL